MPTVLGGGGGAFVAGALPGINSNPKSPLTAPEGDEGARAAR